MFKKFTLIAAFLVGLAISLTAQSITNYAFTASTGAFSPLSGATNPTLIGSTDEGYYNGIPIGFDFWYMGIRYTTISASSNGWITLGANITNATPTNSLTNGGSPRPIIAPLWDDLDLQTAVKVSYLTTGTAGSRTFTIEYLNTKWQNTASGNTISFQVKLYETTGKIEFVYRSESGSVNNGSASIGLSNVTTGSGNFLAVSNAGTSASSTFEASINTKPIIGKTYTFTLPVPVAPDNLTFPSVNSTSVTLNWTDVSSNETGYVIYRSTDGVNYSFVSQTAANTTSASQTGLSAGTTYYWKVYAIVLGSLSSPLAGSIATTCADAPSIVATATETCVGGSTGTITATTTGGTAPFTYSLNGGTYQSSSSFTGLATGNYTINIKSTSACISSTSITVVPYANSTDYQNAAGTDFWIGHVYDGVNFSNYIGHYTETENFNQSFGGSLNCFNLVSNSVTRSIFTETFSAKYRMNSTKKGLYVADIGSDDGGRLTVDGTMIYNSWLYQSFTLNPSVLMNLNGSSSLLYEYFENSGFNQVMFQNLTLVLANNLSTNTSQTICAGSTGLAIGGDVYGTLPSGIVLSGSGYQWSYSTTLGGVRTNISGATSATFTPNTTIAPFNTPGTYYVYRNAALSSTNNIAPNPYIATNESNAATVTINSPFISQIPVANFVSYYKFEGNANDFTGNNTGTLQNAPSSTADRFSNANKAYSFNGSTQYVSTSTLYTNPSNFTLSLWFKTNTTTGGRLIGFGDAQTGQSGNYDRHIYMNNAGQLYFGVYPNAVVTINSALSYNDNNWHLVTATLSSTAGMALYVDGSLVGSNTSTTSAQAFTGYWRIGYDNNNSWTSQPNSFYFSGILDDAIIFSRAITAAEVLTLYNSPDGAGNTGPVCSGSAVSLSATTISGATYSWTGPNSFTASTQNPSFNYTTANAGAYTLTVASNGCSATAYTNLVSSSTAGQWTGNVSTDWSTAGNWCSGIVPTATTNVVISSTATRMPTINSSVVCNNLTINTGATLTTVSAGTLNIAGTLTNSGTMMNGGTTNFNGTTGQQTFSGVSSFNNLILNNTGGLLLPSVITVNNLIITAGMLNANNFNITVKGNWTNNSSTTAFTAGTATVTFNNGSSAQSISGSFTTTFNNLIIADTANTVTLNINAIINGDLLVNKGIFDIGSFSANRSSYGGTLTVANNATLKIGGTNSFPTQYLTNTLVVASTVEYAGTNQTVANCTYGNLTLSSSSGDAVKTFPASSFAIAGNLSIALGAGTSVTLTAASNITVSGSVSIGTSTTFNAGSYAHSVGGNWTNNGTLNGNTSSITLTGPGSVVSGSGTQNFNNLTIAASLISFSNSSIVLSGNLATISSGSFSQASGGTLSMTGSNKTISGNGISLDNLTVSGSVTTTSSFNVTGNLSVSGSLTASAGTITMTGISKTISGNGTKGFTTLSVTGSVTTDANFSIASGLTVSGALSASAGTATFTGTSSLSGIVNLYNTTINGTSLQLSANSVLGISNVFTITTGTLNVSSSMPNTVNFNGSIAQNINAITYDNLIVSNGNSKSAVASIIINNSLTIAANTNFIAGAFTHYIYENFNNYGNFTAGAGAIEFLGSQTTTINGATTFNILTVNNSHTTTGVILNNNVSVATLNMVLGKILTGLDTITITNTRTGSGIIMGNIRRTHSFTTGIAYAFESADNTITFSSVSSVSSITVSVVKGSVTDFTFGAAINRQYTISVPIGTYTATLRLHYEDAELNGNDESVMGLWNYNGTIWIPVSKTANNISSNYIESSGLTNITNRWTLGVTPNAALWTGAVSSDWNDANNWVSVLGSSATPPSTNDIAAIGFAAFANQPTINSSVTVKNVVFGTAQNVILSMASGGSLTSGDMLTVWDNSATHTINANNQTITINGDLNLSDGTSGHNINLNIGTGTVNIAGKLTQSGGSNIIFSGAGNLNISGDFNYINGTFISNTGTVTYNGVNNQVVAGVSYNNLTINKSAAEASINDTTSVAGNFTVTAGEVDNNSITTILGDVTIASNAILENFNVLHIGGNWNNNGNYTGAGINTIFDGSGTQNISATTFNNLEFNKPVGSLAVLTGDVTLKGNLVGTSGTLDIKSFFFNRDVVGGSATIGDSATLIIEADNAPTKFASYYLSPNSTVVFNGTGTQHLALPGVVYGNLIFRNSGTKILYTPITINNNLTIESSAFFDAGSQTITLNGNWINNGTFTPSTSTVIATGASKTITGVTTFNRFSVYGSYTVLNNLTFNSLLNINPTGAIYGDGTINVTMNGDLVNRGILYTLGTTTYTGNVIQNLSLINAVQTVALTVNFNGTIPPILNSTSAPQYGYLNINNTGGINPSVDWTILYALTIGSGASFNGGIATHNILGNLTNNGTITSNGTLNFIPSSTATLNLGSNFSSTGNVVFGGAGATTLAGSPTSFKNIIISNTNGVGITSTSNWNITNNLTINNGSIMNAGDYSHSIGGNLLNNGTINSGTSTFVLNGTGHQDIYNPSAFNNLTINKATGTASLFANSTVNGVLNFVKGNIQTGINILIQPSTGTVTGAAQNTGWVDGKLQKYITTGATTKVFEIGDTVSYAPVSVAFSSVATAGNLTLNTTSGDHPNISSSVINASKNVNRYWSFINNGVGFTAYNASFKYPATEMDAGASSASFGVSIYTGSTWLLTASTLPTDTSIQTTGITSIGDFAIGEICNANTSILYAASPYCSASGTASVTHTGTLGGVYSSTTGLSINASTGFVTLATSSAGAYNVNYSIDAAGGCPSYITAANIIITASPLATISYSGSPYCSNGGIVYPARTGITSGIFSAAEGLIIDSANGSIDLAASTKGTYTVTYTIAALGGCDGYSTSTAVTIGNAGLWTGAINTDWNNAGNWSCAIPAPNDDVVIGISANNPVLNSNVVVNSITLNDTLYLGGNKLTINGGVSGSNKVLSGSNISSIEYAGSGVSIFSFNQSLSADDSVVNGSNALQNLVVSNGEVILSNKLNLFNQLNVTSGTLNTGDNLVLRSTSSNTAFVDKVGGTINGQAIVERYIHSQTRGWRALTAPITYNGIINNNNDKIINNWQSDFGYINHYGTRITGPVAGGLTGLDDITSGSSLQTYNSTIGSWTKVSNTNNETQSGSSVSAANKGFYFFIRGDRTILPTNGGAGIQPNAFVYTTLASKGLLQTGTQTFNFTGTSGKSWLLGNPYACPVNMSDITYSNIGNAIYVWDASLTGSSLNTHGNYATFDRNNWEAGPVQGSTTKYFQSGQAFFIVPSNATASIAFTEENKSTSANNNISTTGTINMLQDIFNVKLLNIKSDGTTSEVDGIRAKYGANYSVAVDTDDIVKWSTPGIENLSLSRDGKSLSIEARPYITTTDTLFLNMISMNIDNYKFLVSPINFDASVSSCRLIDNFLNLQTPISLTTPTAIDFSVTSVAASNTANRFYIVFNGVGSLPTNNAFAVKAYKKENNVLIDWEVISENEIRAYNVEKSSDGISFSKLGEVKAKNGRATNQYHFVDNIPGNVNYYRIQTINNSGTEKYSAIVRVDINSNLIPGFAIYPNPVTNNSINLQLTSMEKGSYIARMVNTLGQQVTSFNFNYIGGSSTRHFPLKQSLPKGIYTLQLTNSKGETMQQNFILE